jgi:hypothetical protein
MTTTPQELSQEQRHKIYQFLKQHPVGVLATVDPKGDPHASTIFFSVDDQLNITFTTKRGTDKHANIVNHKVVMLATYDAANQAAVQASGEAIEITDQQEALDVFRGTLQAAQKTGEDEVPPVAKISAGPYVAYKITPANIWLMEYGQGSSFTNALKHASDAESNQDPA